MKDEKIFDNEVLSDEELENVVGGSNGEIADDSRFLRDKIQTVRSILWV